MNLDGPGLATLGAVALSWVVIWYLRKRRLNFSLIALLALAVGIPIGIVARAHVETIQPIGQIYINLLLATVAPLILVAIISAITGLGSIAKLRSIGLRSVFWLLLSNALGVALALGLALTFQPGKDVSYQLGGLSTDAIQGQVQDFSEVLVGFFPTNVIQSFSANQVIPIILIAVTVSVAYLAIAEKEFAQVRAFRDGAEALKLVIFKAVGYVIRLTPYAVVALTADMVGSSTNLGESFKSLVGLLVLVWIACFVHAFVINGAILTAFANVSPIAFFRKIFPAQLTAFSTQSSVGTLPVTTARLTREVGVHSEIAHFTAPLGTTIGMPGCAGIWPIMVAVWGINAYGLSYSAGDYVVLALLAVIVSVGTAGVPGAATVAAATVLSAARLPLEFVAATIPISIIADMARTMNNVTAAAVSATVVARQTGLLDDDIFAGRTQFVDDDELAESETVEEAEAVRNRIPVGAYAGAYAALPAAGWQQPPGPPPPGTPHQQPAPALTWPRSVPYEGAPDPTWQPPPSPAQHHPRVYWGTEELAAPAHGTSQNGIDRRNGQ
ncbi:dicarboxylate/amino acid:cation symporter [Conexibacter stalactiti]|uniref:Dicarboxylate/amino acid:cation symporter n=1 Tax=Conexibacter stalactiti TaxID=1940611 RepID=A0ABU4HXU9_9ACTN|nr:dicarboxylate/amino acid:cation symporter [Conexibacter stalactiti]MDW5598133.1 dicarboxylate/amino acid:cation symporter [Conexibacter stalactiti]MEC5038775.1 dicarboxylate/amino acid:cation symporter [Conexibacter stalactiti]